MVNVNLLNLEWQFATLSFAVVMVAATDSYWFEDELSAGSLPGCSLCGSCPMVGSDVRIGGCSDAA